MFYFHHGIPLTMPEASHHSCLSHRSWASQDCPGIFSFPTYLTKPWSLKAARETLGEWKVEMAHTDIIPYWYFCLRWQAFSLGEELVYLDLYQGLFSHSGKCLFPSVPHSSPNTRHSCQMIRVVP